MLKIEVPRHTTDRSGGEEAIALVHVSVGAGALISIIVGVELVAVVVHACVVSIVVWIHAVTAIIVGCSAHLNSPILKLVAVMMAWMI